MTALLHIDEIYVFVADNPGVGEGVMAYWSPDYGWVPMVAADRTRYDQLRSVAEHIATQTDRVIKVVRFTTRTQIDIITPRTAPTETPS